MKVYKLTRSDLTTYGGFLWEIGKTYETSGKGSLCSSGWLHFYEHPLLAVLHNPIHAAYPNFRIFEAEASGEVKKDGQMKSGATGLTLIREIEAPKINTEQRIKYALLCAKVVCKDAEFNAWADKWLSGEVRTKEAARAAVARAAAAWAAAAAAAAADINLIAFAEEATR